MDNQKDLCRSKDSLDTNKPTCTFQQYGEFLVNTRMGHAEQNTLTYLFFNV